MALLWKILGVFCGAVCFWCVAAILLLIMSDRGAEITRDGFPLTSGLTYVMLAVGAVVSGATSIIAGSVYREKMSGKNIRKNKKIRG